MINQLPLHLAVGEFPAVMQGHPFLVPGQPQQVKILRPRQPLPSAVVQEQDLVAGPQLAEIPGQLHPHPAGVQDLPLRQAQASFKAQVRQIAGKLPLRAIALVPGIRSLVHGIGGECIRVFRRVHCPVALGFPELHHHLKIGEESVFPPLAQRQIGSAAYFPGVGRGPQRDRGFHLPGLVLPEGRHQIEIRGKSVQQGGGPGSRGKITLHHHQLPRFASISRMDKLPGTGGQAEIQVKRIKHRLHPGPGPSVPRLLL
ncbi:MAG: hypothetical protein A2Z73_07045 [Deltaproteobacteria bacterium RBG_13_60_28]|nr:MAG: hypothetical protein A2Z73_07045 [Deltaproteobacteria bacterium RBG_13_60_28]